MRETGGLDFTERIKESHSQLFIHYKEPHKKVARVAEKVKFKAIRTRRRN